MIQSVPQMRILLATDPVDFRKGIDGLSGICRGQLRQDPFSGAMFLFTNRKRTAIKILVYDGQGFWLCMKRLSRGRIRWWPRDGKSGLTTMAACELQVLLYNGNPAKTDRMADWRQLVGK